MSVSLLRFTLVAAILTAEVGSAASPQPQSQVRLHAADANSPWSGAVTRFYEGRQNAAIWFPSGPRSPAAIQLIAILQRAELDGLASGPDLAVEVQAAIQRAQNGSAEALLEAELTLSSAWVTYVLALRSQGGSVISGDAQIAPRTGVATILFDAASAPSLEQHLVSTSDVNPFYSSLRNAAWRLSQMTRGNVDKRTLANLARTRTFSAARRYVLVDVASARLFMYEDGAVRGTMKVIVGNLDHRTPLIASLIHYTTVNPYWNPPEDLVRHRIAPAVLQQGASYLSERGYEILDGPADNAPLMMPDQVNWAAVVAGREHVRLRRKPSAANPMGEIKIPFANDRGIYLHDTPDKSLFGLRQRTLSHGCIRLEDAPRLARWLLGREPVAPSAAPERHLHLPEPVPILVTYLTAHPSVDGIAFTEDVYGLDREWEMEVAAASREVVDRR